MSHPFVRRPPESTLATGYRILDDGRRVAVDDEEKRRRQVAAVMRAVGIAPVKEEAPSVEQRRERALACTSAWGAARRISPTSAV